MHVIGTAGHVDHGKSTLVNASPASIPTASKKKRRAA
jgi:translation elongation factor EF-Tu-like GTPase